MGERGRGLDAGPGRGAERLRVSRPWRRRGRRPHLLRVGGRLERHDAGLGVPPVRRAAVVRRLARVAPAREVGHPLEVELELAAAGYVGGGGRTRTALGRRRGGRCGRFSRDSVVQETGRRECPSRRARGWCDLILSLGGRSRCRSPRNVRHRRHRRGKSFVLELQLLKGEMVLFPPPDLRTPPSSFAPGALLPKVRASLYKHRLRQFRRHVRAVALPYTCRAVRFTFKLPSDCFRGQEPTKRRTTKRALPATTKGRRLQLSHT